LYGYKFSTVTVYSDYSHPFLDSYKVTTPSSINQKVDAQINESSDSIYSGPGIVEDKVYDISLHKSTDSYHLSINDIAEFFISNDGYHIHLLKSLVDKNSHTILSAFTGPALILALSLNNIFCIHASSIRYKGRTALFIGKSGVGKSTIAEELFSDYDSVIRTSDDILPIRLGGLSVYALPRFPQLKLDEDAQYPKEFDEKIPVSDIFILNKEDKVDEYTITDCPSMELAENLIKQTISSVLFDNHVLKNHLELCSTTASSHKGKKVSFSHDLNKLPSLCKMILDDIECSKDI